MKKIYEIPKIYINALDIDEVILTSVKDNLDWSIKDFDGEIWSK